MNTRNRRILRRMIPVAVIVLVLVVIAGYVLKSLIRPSDWVLDTVAGFYPGIVFRVDTTEPVIALTIDDAPHPDVTPGILEVLRRHNARATFFVIGEYAQRYPDLVEAIRSDGHELANHLFTDRMSAGLSDGEFVDELLRTDALIRPGDPPRWCRAGSGVTTPRMVELMNEHGYTPVLGTAYPVDLYTTEDLTIAQFMNNVRPGAILVLHDGGSDRGRTVGIISHLLPRLEEEGYRVATMTELSRLGPPVLESNGQ
jgi:peptidoglycan/xylan/chitin deacetylase (PgdA/CDA1 family)